MTTAQVDGNEADTNVGIVVLQAANDCVLKAYEFLRCTVCPLAVSPKFYRLATSDQVQPEGATNTTLSEARNLMTENHGLLSDTFDANDHNTGFNFGASFPTYWLFSGSDEN